MSDRKPTISYYVNHATGTGGTSVEIINFRDQAQADRACERIANVAPDYRRVAIDTLHGKAVIEVGPGFTGMYPARDNPIIEPADDGQVHDSADS